MAPGRRSATAVLRRPRAGETTHHMVPLSHIAILRWPEEAGVVAYLRTQGRPRLLLVAPDADPPTPVGPDEDWIRLPAREDDIRVRAEALQARVEIPDDPPTVGADGRLHWEGQWVALSPTEEGLCRALADQFGQVVRPDALAASSTQPLTPTAVRVHITRLRKRIAPLGLTVRAVRGRGYVLGRAI